MKGWIAVALTAVAVGISSPSEARGRFLAGLLSSSAKIGVGAASSSARKSYTADTLTVAQLAQCIKGAAKLDNDAERIEEGRTALRLSIAALDQSEATMTQRQSSLNRTSKSAVKSFNEAVGRHNELVASVKTKQADFNTVVNLHNDEVKAHNSECAAKRYYADDLPEAQKQAGISGG